MVQYITWWDVALDLNMLNIQMELTFIIYAYYT